MTQVAFFLPTVPHLGVLVGIFLSGVAALVVELRLAIGDYEATAVRLVIIEVEASSSIEAILNLYPSHLLLASIRVILFDVEDFQLNFDYHFCLLGT